MELIFYYREISEMSGLTTLTGSRLNRLKTRDQ